MNRKAANDRATAAAERGDVAAAEQLFKDALAISRRLSPAEDVAKDDALRMLAGFYASQNRIDDAIRIYEERINAPYRVRPDLLGLAYFDLISAYAAKQELEKARSAADHAVAAYRDCIARDKGIAAVCDRRMADVQGIMGSVYFQQKKFDESEPWFKAVIDRSDEAVRPQVMLVSLQAYTTLLIARGDIAEATRFAERAVKFEKDHPGSNQFSKPKN